MFGISSSGHEAVDANTSAQSTERSAVGRSNARGMMTVQSPSERNEAGNHCERERRFWNRIRVVVVESAHVYRMQGRLVLAAG